MSAPPPPPEQRLRVTYGKVGALVYIGHLDLARLWERVTRRAGLPLAYSHGFNPRPRIQLADALPLGVSSACELIDLYMKTPVAPEGVGEHLQAAAPPGLAVHEVAEADMKAPALQTLIEAADYTVTFPEGIDAAGLAARVDAFVAQEHVKRERRGKPYDLRPRVLALQATPGGALEARLSLGAAGTGRPDELLDALGLGGELAAVHRARLYLRS
jgi:radical SAM-linked protein